VCNSANNLVRLQCVAIFLRLSARCLYQTTAQNCRQHTPSYATVKNWLAQFKRDDFCNCVAPPPGRHKTVTTPEIIGQIHELNLEEHRISAKSIAENWESYVSGLVPSFLKIWTCGSSPRSWSRNAWTRIKNVNVASHMSNFRNFFGAIQIISYRNCWPWKKLGYITMTGRHSNNQWIGGLAAHPATKINSECFDFLGSRLHPPLYLKKDQTINGEYYSSLLVQFKVIFKEKRRGNVTKCVLFLHDNAPSHRALANQKELSYLGFRCLVHPPYSPNLAPSVYRLFSGLKKTIEISQFILRRGGHSWHGNLVGRTNLWFFEWLA